MLKPPARNLALLAAVGHEIDRLAVEIDDGAARGPMQTIVGNFAPRSVHNATLLVASVSKLLTTGNHEAARAVVNCLPDLLH